MAKRFSHRVLLAAALAPLMLGLAACKKEGGEAAPSTSSTPLAKVAAPAGKAWIDVVETNAEGGYVLGNPNAPVKVQEYGSLSCPACAALGQAGFSTLINNYVASGRVSLEFRSFAIHGVDVPLTMLAQCGDKQSFFPLVEQIYGNFEAVMTNAQSPEAIQKAQNAMTLPEKERFVVAAREQGLTEFFAQRGISVDQANACLANFDKANAIAKLADDYGNKGISSTPTLFINGNKLESSTWPELNAALQRAGVRD